MTQDTAPSAKRTKYVVAGVVVLLAAVGIGFRIHAASETKSRLSEMYPRLEALVAIYSVLSWTSAEQQPPRVTERSQYGGSEFTLDCPNIKWGAGGFDRSDALFSCFALPKTKYVPVAGEEIESTQFAGGEEWSYDFALDTVFGYQVIVTVTGHEALDKGSELRKEREACLEELASYNNRHSICFFNTYQVTLDGLTASKAISFITANGRLSWHADGTVSRREERVIYLDGAEPLTAGQINEVVQKTLRALGIAERDMSKIAPQLETLWVGKDEAFMKALFAELDKTPDLLKLSGFIQGK